MFDMHIELQTYEEFTEEEFRSAHIFLGQMDGKNTILFEKQWTALATQGLYASKVYLEDVGEPIDSAKQLVKHAILGLGNSFNRDEYKRQNWHLSDEFDLGFVEPSMIINSQSALMNAVETSLGIAPIRDYYCKISQTTLVRVLPEIEGPVIKIDFAIRKFLPQHIRNLVQKIEQEILSIVLELDLEVTYD
jgi:DNA-binding transcriptional LysR family regulator